MRHRQPALARLLFLPLILPLMGFFNLERLFAPEAELWERWTTHDPDSTTRIDHAAWSEFLAAYLVAGDDGINRVRYGAVTPEDRAALTAYLDALQRVDVDSLARPEQFPYWINLYNAATVAMVIDALPIDSIRDIELSDGPWKTPILEVAGEALTLNDIEHRILRPIWRDPRIHYAVNCASIGCPNLRPQAYTRDTAEAALEEGARAYVNHPRGVDIEDGDLTVSKIYNWFRDDFGDSDAAVIAHLRRYAATDLADRLTEFEDVDDYVYDWSLNAAR